MTDMTDYAGMSDYERGFADGKASVAGYRILYELERERLRRDSERLAAELAALLALIDRGPLFILEEN